MKSTSLYRPLRLLILTLLIIIIREDATAQIGSSCDSAQLFSSGVSCFNGINSSDSVRWLAFDADSNRIRIEITNTGGPSTAYANRVEIYSGPCSALSLIGSWDKAPTDTFLIVDSSAYIIGNRYYVRVLHQQQTACSGCSPNAHYNICKVPAGPLLGGFNGPQYFEGCGLNFIMSKVILHQQQITSANPVYGGAQPAALNVSGIPAAANVQKAYLYFICKGNTASTINVTVTLPNNTTASVQAVTVGVITTSATGWGAGWGNRTTGYRADMTQYVQQFRNANYTLSGLPNQPTGLTKEDTDGATMYVVYTNPCAPNTRMGKIWLRDGLAILENLDTLTYSITGSSYPSNINGGAFFCVGDVQENSQNNRTSVAGYAIPNAFWSNIYLTSGFASFANNYAFNWMNVAQQPSKGDASAMVFYGIYTQDGSSYCGPPIMVDAGPNQYFCGPDSYVLPAWSIGGHGNLSYSWSPGTGLNGTNFANPLATPTVTTTYTLTVSSDSGCTRTDTVTIYVNDPPTVGIEGPQYADCDLTKEFYYENSDCDPDVSYTWTFVDGNGDTTIVTGCSATFSVPPSGGTVYLEASNLLGDCSRRDSLIVNGCCFPQAWHVPYYMNNTTAQAVINDGSLGSFMNGTTLSYPIVVINGLFTVDAPSFTISGASIAMGQNARIVVKPGCHLILDSSQFALACNIMWDGVYVKDKTASLTVQRNSIFRYSRNGVVSQKGGAFYLYDSQFEDNYRHVVAQAYASTLSCDVRNCKFTYTGSFPPAVPALPATAIRPDVAFMIDSVQNILIGNSTLASYRNTIERCDFAFRIDQSNVKVVNNLIRQLPQNPNIFFSGVGVYTHAKKLKPTSLVLGGPGANEPNVFQRYYFGVDAYNYVNVDAQYNSFDDGATNTGQFGIGVFNGAGRTISIAHNTFTRHKTAVWVNEALNANITINDNVINAPSFGSNGTGIQVEAVLLQPMTLNISGNTMNRTRTGIWTNTITGSFTQPNPSIRYNNVLFDFSDASVIGFGRHYGVRVTNCISVDAEANYVDRAPMPVLNVDTLLRGIHVEYSSSTIVNGNTFRHMSDGIWMEQSNTGSQLTCNLMDSCYDGVRLNNATIGDQFGNFANDNRFSINTAGPNSLNLDLKGAVPLLDTTYWYYRNNAGAYYIPTWTVFGPFYVPSNNSSNSGCTPIPPPAPLVRNTKYSEPIENEQTQDDPDYNWWNCRNIYGHFHRQQQELTLNTPDDTLYQHFYSRTGSGSIGQMSALTDSLTNGNLAAAVAINNNLPTETTMEDLRKTVNNIYLSTWALDNRVLSTADSATLYTIAFGNPATWGDAVFSARVMLGIDPTATFGSRMGAPEEAADTARAMGADMFPQPASDQATLVFPIMDNEKASLIFFTIVGQQIKTVSLSEGRNHSFSIADLPPGVYLYRVLVDGQCRKADRFVIMK